MESVKVNKTELIRILEKNKREHRGIFLKAQEAYRTMVIEQLDKELAKARHKQPFDVRRFYSFALPQDHTEEYETAISMLKMSVDKQVVITDQQFRNFVNDDWEWSRSWAVSNAHYTSSAKFKKYTTS